MTKTKKGIKVWITKDGTNDDYEVWAKKPKWRDIFWSNDYRIIRCCPKDFEKVTKIKLKGGENSIIRGYFQFKKD